MKAAVTLATTALAAATLPSSVLSFSLSPKSWTASSIPTSRSSSRRRNVALSMALDPVTYLRTEWVSAALCTNQTPRAADVCLQLGSEDGRVVNFVPRTIREIITSSAEGKGEGLTVSCERSLKQMAERRNSAKVTISNQPADDLTDTPSATVDVVISLQAAERMHENGLDWKRSIREAGRVLKPGGRLLFVESTEIAGESFLEYVMSLSGVAGMGEELEPSGDDPENPDEKDMYDVDGSASEKQPPIFEEVGFDDVDMVLQPHVAGVAIKALDADLTIEQRARKKSQEEEDRLAEIAMTAFERGNKSRRKRKKKKASAGDPEGQ
ncbi:hypothetical protein ACHAXS_003144 [Conticribra weissflogii]